MTPMTKGHENRPFSQTIWIIVQHLQSAFERNEITIKDATDRLMAEIKGYYAANGGTK